MMGPDIPGERRMPCPRCGAMILIGAQKCRGCKRWTQIEPDPSGLRVGRALVGVLLVVVGVASVWLGNRESPVGDAPPLSPLPAGSSQALAALNDLADEPSPAALGPEAPKEKEPTGQVDAVTANWRTRSFRVDTHPLDAVFSAGGKSVFVSFADATLREYDLLSGRLKHMTTVPAQGDRLRLLHQRYVAVVPRNEGAHIPIVDTQAWEKEPMLLWVGQHPADIVGLPDGKTVITASSLGKRLTSYNLVSGRRVGDIRLPHATRKLYLLRDGDRPIVGALGTMRRGGRPVGAWIDMFDPSEAPFGATRRSIAVGRDPRVGAVTADRSSLFFVDKVANSAAVLGVDASTKLHALTVGQAPVAGFLMANDRYGVTLDSAAQTATVVELDKPKRCATLMLDGAPNGGATSAAGHVLFVSLGGSGWPPRTSGAAIIAGEPPQVVAHVDTSGGASRVAAARDGSAAVVLSFIRKTITVIQRD